MCLVFVFEAFLVILGYSWKTYMVKLIFKAYNKTEKIFVYNFFLYVKMKNNYYQKHKEKLPKEARVRYQNLSDEKKRKSTNMLVGDIEIFLTKKKKRSVNMLVNDLNI